METEGPSVLRLITSELESTKNVLTSLGTEFRVSEVLAVAAREPHRRPGQGARKAGRRTYQRRICLCFDSSGAGQGTGNLSHFQPETRLSDLERSRSTVIGIRPLRRADAPCTHAEAGQDALRSCGRDPSSGGFQNSAVKKKKVRVALRKNRQNRTRANDLTRRFRNDELTGTPRRRRAIAFVPRVSCRGIARSSRTHPADQAQSAPRPTPTPPSRRAVDLSVCLRGRVVRVHGLISMVRSEDGRVHACHVRRLLKSLEIEGRSVVTVGDWVWFRPGTSAGADGLIEKVEIRRGVITRGYRHRQHVIAANVDQVSIVSAFDEPGLKLNLIDRYLVSAEIGGVRPVIVLNKADLVDLATHQWIIGLYVQLGYETIVTSVADGRGLDRLRDLLTHGVTAVTGQSGVGKSSLLNAIQPDLNLKVREVSEWTSKGKHTTTTCRADRACRRRLRRRHPGPETVRALGNEGRGAARGNISVELPPLHPRSLPLSRSRSHSHESALRRQGGRAPGQQIHPGAAHESYL